MRYIRSIIVFITIFILSGCSLVNESENSFKLKYFQSTFTTNFSDVTEELFEGIQEKMAILDKRNPVYVVDFVNLKNLSNNTELGFMLSEEIKTQVSQKLDIPIVSIEYMKYLKLGKSGSRFLTRDIKQLNNTKVNKNTYALVGTYAFTQRQLILYLKLIDLTNGVIIKSSTKATTLTDEIIHFETQKQQPKEPVVFRPMVL
jgi:TolB-like protein